jgi:transposase-like protein
MALAIVVDAKKGISANQLKEHLGIGSYRTAWYMTHRIRKAMEDDCGLLHGTVEIDETYIGGKSKRRGAARNQKPRSEKFDMVLGMRERKGRVKFVHIDDGKAGTIRKAISENVHPQTANVYTDSAAVYQFAFHPGLKKRHQMVNHTIQWIVPGTDIHTNTVESSFSLLKRGLIGSFHRISIKHLHRYLSEFEFRWNIRKDEDRFSRTLRRMAGIPPMPYIELIAVPKTEV